MQFYLQIVFNLIQLILVIVCLVMMKRTKTKRAAGEITKEQVYKNCLIALLLVIVPLLLKYVAALIQAIF